MAVALRVPWRFLARSWRTVAVLLGVVMVAMWLVSGLSVLVLGGAQLLGSNGILAVFAAGVAFDAVATTRERVQEERVQEVMNRFFTLPIFLFFGLAVPWDDWVRMGWTSLALVVGVLLLRRLPALLAVSPLLGRIEGLRNVLFLGWFGPIGVSPLYYATLAGRHSGIAEVWPIVSLVMFASIVVHGVTATPFTQLCGKDWHWPQKAAPALR